MPFTYNQTLEDDRDKVRFYIQDTIENSGPKPGATSATNFTDAEIEALITSEGDWQRAVAGAFEALAMAWARYPTFTADGVSVSRSNIASQYAAQAAIWRKRHGYPGASSTATIVRTDAYTDSGSEYT